MNELKKLLIAVDGGPASERIAAEAFQLGKKLNAEMAVISVADTTLLVSESGMTTAEFADSIKSSHKDNLQILADKIFGGFKVWLFIEEGSPADAILRVAGEWDADLVVLGTHARKGLSHLLLGSVAEKVVRHSSKSLYIIPINHG
ncbi:MAG: universal stress protein [Bacteroidetes bacterium]|nr:universal stress protein [Bacteroidota bacterium]